MTRGAVASKVPAVTLTFWIVKILATTLGETAGDTVSMTMHLGYLVGTAIFLGALVVLVALQIAARKFHPFLYWLTIIASTTAGTTMADFADRSLGIGYPGGSILLFAAVLASLGAWYWSEGAVSVQSVNTPRVEAFYWLTITFSQTLGTALGGLGGGFGLGLWRRRAGVRRGHRGRRRAPFLGSPFARPLVLAGLYPDAAAGRDGGRFLRQAAGAGRAGRQPADRQRDSGGGHRSMHSHLPAARRIASGRRLSLFSDKPDCSVRPSF